MRSRRSAFVNAIFEHIEQPRMCSLVLSSNSRELELERKGTGSRTYPRRSELKEDAQDISLTEQAKEASRFTTTGQLVLIRTPRNRRILPRSAYHWRAIDEILRLVNLFIESGLIFVIKNRSKVDRGADAPGAVRRFQSAGSGTGLKDSVGDRSRSYDQNKKSYLKSVSATTPQDLAIGAKST